MPELPELELLRHALSGYLIGRKIEGVVLDPSRAFIVRYPPQEFPAALAARTFASVERRGKFLLFGFERSEERLVVNPALGGRFAFCSRVAPALPATCFTLQLSRGHDLRFLDSTLMARIYFTANPPADVPTFAALGPDALDPKLDYNAFAARLRKHRGELKNLFRNQSFVAGIGNAYADEVLWAAGLSPLRRAGTLTEEERNALYRSMRATLKEAVTTTRRQYEDGKHPLHKQDRGFLKIHGKAKTTCPRCGHRISTVHSGGQATFFCRGCQR